MNAPPKITQQGSSQPNCGSCQPHWPSRCRALAASVLLAVAVLSVGCGDVLFVPSPYTPQNVDLVYSAQEDISIVRWRISSTAQPGEDLYFQILGDDGYTTIDFSHSLFPGGGSACADGVGACFQYVVPGQYPVGRFPRPIRAVHATYGTLPGELANAKTEAETLSVSPFFHINNDLVYAGLTDLVAYDSVYVYPRGYDRTMWSTIGLCVSDSPPATVSFSPLDSTSYGFAPDLPLSESGIYCVGIRPTPSDGGTLDSSGCLDGGYCPRVAQGRVATQPQLTDMHQTFVPPVEQSPVIYQIVLDLEIPVAERCTSSLATIESLVDKYMHMTTVPVVKLPTLNLATNSAATGGSTNCAQGGAGRTLAATDMAQAVLRQVSSFPQTHQQFHFFYFNNLDAPLPTTLTDSLYSLFNGLTAPPPYDLWTFSWLFNPGFASATGPSWWMTTAWQAANDDDPTLERTLAMYAAQSLPYTSQTYDQSVPVPLLSAADVAKYDGGFFKICDSSPYAQPASSHPPYYPLSGDGAWLIKASDPPGYFVTLPQQIAVPGASFTKASASIDFQVCSAYCDHPYVSTAGTGETSWETSPLCAGLK